MPNLDEHIVDEILHKLLDYLPRGYICGVTSVGSSAYCGPYIAQVKLEYGEIWLRKTTLDRGSGLKRISLADPKCFEIAAELAAELEKADGS